MDKNYFETLANSIKESNNTDNKRSSHSDTAFLTVKVDIDCKLYCDGDFLDLVEANKVKKIPIEVGQHLITIESENVEGVSEDREVSIDESGKNYLLIVKDLHAKEEEVTRLAEEKKLAEEQKRETAELKRKEEEERQRIAAEKKRIEEEERQKREERERLRIEEQKPYCTISYKTTDGEMIENLNVSFNNPIISHSHDPHDDTWVNIYFQMPIKNIPDNAFSMDSCKKKLVSIDLPHGLESIGAKAFLNQTELVSVGMPDTVREIGGEAFKNCSSLMSSDPFGDYTLPLPKELVHIGSEAFLGLDAIKHISFGEKIVNLDTACFSQCKNIRNVNLPDSVKEIGIGCFSECSSLREINFGSGIQYVFTNAFRDCKNLELVIFHSIQCPKVSANSFYGCERFKVTFACKVDKDSYRACKEFDGRKDWGIFN